MSKATNIIYSCLANLFFPFPDVLDGAMILLAMISLNVLHPGYLLFRKDEKKSANSSFSGPLELSVMN